MAPIPYGPVVDPLRHLAIGAHLVEQAWRHTNIASRLRDRDIRNSKSGRRGHQFITLKVVLPETEGPELIAFLETWRPKITPATDPDHRGRTGPDGRVVMLCKPVRILPNGRLITIYDEIPEPRPTAT